MVLEAWEKVKANEGAGGVDGESIAEFEQDLKSEPVPALESDVVGELFPAAGACGGDTEGRRQGVRVLGVPTVADRIAQTVVRLYLEPEVEPLFHEDSYGYRPGRSALDAVGVCRQRCWRNDWVIDLDIRAFFDSLDHDLMMAAVAKHTDLAWVLLYVGRWLKAPLQHSDGTLVRGIGEPRRALRSRRCWRTCSCTTRSTRGSAGTSRRSRSSVTR